MTRQIRIRKLRRKLERLFPFIRLRCDMRSARYRRLEKKIAPYELPDPLLMLDGTRVDRAEIWRRDRRPELIELFRTHVYGRCPAQARIGAARVLSMGTAALDGLAVRKEVLIDLDESPESPKMCLLLYLPLSRVQESRRVPIFLGLNFFGNHTIHVDPGIGLPAGWVPTDSIFKDKTSAAFRGIDASSWPVEALLRRGYGLVTAYCGDIAPDRTDGLDMGLVRWYRDVGTIPPAGDSWGAIGAWAWGLSRAVDYLETDPQVDGERIILVGHSRLGKAALWAGAQDERFAVVISNESGCGGAALSRRRFGETVAMINVAFPHWFCQNFRAYGGREEMLPVDQHQLISLVAPRPVYVASADLDLQADPIGEFLAAKNANPVYRLLGTEGLPAEDFPARDSPVMGTIGYHLREGAHGITPVDWSWFMDFADKHLRSREDGGGLAK